MGSEAISRGPRGGVPVRSNRREVRSKEAAEESGERKMNDNALTALALLIAVSDPKEKDKLVKIITNLIK